MITVFTMDMRTSKVKTVLRFYGFVLPLFKGIEAAEVLSRLLLVGALAGKKAPVNQDELAQTQGFSVSTLRAPIADAIIEIPVTGHIAEVDSGSKRSQVTMDQRRSLRASNDEKIVMPTSNDTITGPILHFPL